MSFKRKVPSTAGELRGYLASLHKNRTHITSIKVNPSNNHLEIDLDGAANFFGYADMYIPLKPQSIEEAKDLIAQLMARSDQRLPPSDADAQHLFDMIDQQGA
jgi:hypothetical protein